MDESWFNGMQNLDFVHNPVDDGEYPLLCESAIDFESFDARHITIGTVQTLKVASLVDCTLVDSTDPDAAVTPAELKRILSEKGSATIRPGANVNISENGVISLEPTPVSADSILLGNGIKICYGEVLLNNRSGGNVSIRVSFSQSFKTMPSSLGLLVRYVDNASDRFKVINAINQTEVEQITLNGATIKSYWDQGGGGRPQEYSVYWSFIGS